jgi:UDP-2,3-diacylglucosamine hydrolase
MWIGDDDDSPLALAITNLLKSASKNCDIFLMHGNRDFLFGNVFAANSGVQLIQDPKLIGKQLLISHGDTLCTDDHAYQAMRTILRSEKWQQEILAKSLAERQVFGQNLRAQSKTKNANKSSEIMDVNTQAVYELLDPDTRVLIHGHTHRPGIHLDDKAGVTRIVLGDWGPCGWLCRQIDGDFSLECFNLAHRYEI